MEARVVTAGPDLEEVRALFREYAEWVAVDLSFQGFAEELAGLPGDYLAPHGTLLLCVVEEASPGAAGCIGIRRWQADACETQRLYERLGFRDIAPYRFNPVPGRPVHGDAAGGIEWRRPW